MVQRNSNMKKPKELFSNNIDELDKFELTTKHIFECIDSSYKEIKNWKNFFDQLDDKDQKKITRLGHFYYFICQPFQNYGGDNNEREKLALVGITSLIESMMTIEEYKDFFDYFESTYKGENKIENFKEIKEEYLRKYSCTGKIRNYFKKYINQKDREIFLKRISCSKDNKGFNEFDDIEKIANFLYQMRSDFVHNAKMSCLCPKHCESAYMKIAKKDYKIKINIEEFLRMFERSFVYYWKNFKILDQ
jgi:hypothetical protein